MMLPFLLRSHKCRLEMMAEAEDVNFECNFTISLNFNSAKFTANCTRFGFGEGLSSFK